MSASTATRALAAVKKLAEHKGLPDPTLGVRRPRRDKGLPRPVEGLPFVLKAMDDNGDFALKWTCVFGASTGLRIAEACQQDGKHFEVVDGGKAIRVFGKGMKEGIVPLDDSAKTAMAMLTPPHGEFRIPFTVKQLQTALRRYGVRFHQLRHTFGSQTYNRTRDIYVTSRLMRHASVASTQGYAEISSDVLYEAMTTRRAAMGGGE